MAGPGASIRVNGFRRGGLPPKDQIREIRFRQNAYAADSHESSNFSVDITTQPGSRGWRSSTTFGFRDESLDARNAFATTDQPEQTRRVQFSLDGPIWQKRTSTASTPSRHGRSSPPRSKALTPGPSSSPRSAATCASASITR
jgi:hypothetical protein